MQALSLSGLAWSACRLSSLSSGAAPLSSSTWTPPDGAECIPALVPGTILSALLAHGTWTQPGNSSAPIYDPYVDDWLANATIPDISSVGAAFYTFVFRASLPDNVLCGCVGVSPGSRALVTLSAAQLSYRASLYMDGVQNPVPTLEGDADAVGMFKRHDWILGSARAWCNETTNHGLSLLVRPPDHPGLPAALCPVHNPAFNTSTPCGQGGDHSLAQDIVSQDLGGWDWVAASPDRNTGLVDGLEVHVAPAGVLLRDGAVFIDAVQLGGDGGFGSPLASGTISFRASLRNAGALPMTGTLVFTIVGDGEGEVLSASTRVVLPAGGRGWVEAESAPLPLTPGTALWWPHSVGEPTLRGATASFSADGAAADEPPTAIAWRAGLRTVSCDVDARIGGRACAINGLPFFIEGGNFIGTDLLSRPAWRTVERYAAEVALHSAMGFNTMRLWGGHAGHPAALFDAADEEGILLWNEFFMTGDNNGRWAGNASWPLDHSLYGDAVADTAKRLRGHASLLVHVAGNELFPFDTSPSADVIARMASDLATLDPSTPFVQSSMGSNEFGGFSGFDPLRAFAPSDGPYGILDARSFFAFPAPGKPANFSIPWAFQPEVGAAAHPSLTSLARFLSPAALDTLPGPRGVDTPPLWAWHNFQSWGDNTGGDEVYALAPAGNATPPTGWTIADYTAAAAVAQEAQLRALFESYADRMWEPRSGVLYWKSSSPWPALRGALYDWYLSTGGGFWGARHALERLHVQLSRRPSETTAHLAVVNRGRDAPGPFFLTAKAFDLHTGALLTSQAAPFLPSIAAQSVVQISGSTLVWPAGAPSDVALLWRIEMADAAGMLVSKSEYTLSTLSNDPFASPQNLTALAAARARPLALTVVATCGAAAGAGGGGGVRAAVLVSLALSEGVVIAVRCELRDAAHAVVAQTGASDDRILPLFASEGFFSLLGGEERALVLTAAGGGGVPVWPSATLAVECEGWNAPPVRVLCGSSP